VPCRFTQCARPGKLFQQLRLGGLGDSHGRTFNRLDSFFRHRVPGITTRATTYPTGGIKAAFATYKNALGLGQRFRPLSLSRQYAGHQQLISNENTHLSINECFRQSSYFFLPTDPDSSRLCIAMTNCRLRRLQPARYRRV